MHSLLHDLYAIYKCVREIQRPLKRECLKHGCHCASTLQGVDMHHAGGRLITCCKHVASDLLRHDARCMVSWPGARTSPPVQLMYSWMGFLFSVSRYSIVATSWLPSSSSMAFPRKMMRSRYCAAV